MIHSISSTSATQPVAAPATAKLGPKTSQSKPKSSESTDTVQLSSAAQAALKELTETPAQTTKEANGGDRQAQRLLAKQSAAKLQSEPSASAAQINIK